MRGTVHLVMAKDCHRPRSLVQPALGRMLRTNATHRGPLADIDVTAIVDEAKRLLDAKALSLGVRPCERRGRADVKRAQPTG